MNTLFISSFPAAPPGNEGATAPQLGDWVFLPDPIETHTLVVHWCAPLNHPQGGVPAVAAELVHDAKFKIYARGTIRHPNHDAIHLAGWHRVFLRGIG
jgi:hypothetical protein